MSWPCEVEERLTFLRRFLSYVHGVPSHDTLCEVVAALGPELFKACFTAWVEQLRGPAPELGGPDAAGPEVTAVDGETSRRSHARPRGHGSLHTVSA